RQFVRLGQTGVYTVASEYSSKAKGSARPKAPPGLRHVDSGEEGLRANQATVWQLDRKIERPGYLLGEAKSDAVGDPIVILNNELETGHIVNKCLFQVDLNRRDRVWGGAHRKS